jgi:bifunctional DNA-binding transcriptional regulator/antitoxin component of YhaV-PrlF toxin-antitoxin module
MLLSQVIKLDKQGRLHIPKKMLEHAGLSPGSEVYITASQQCIVVQNPES